MSDVCELPMQFDMDLYICYELLLYFYSVIIFNFFHLAKGPQPGLHFRVLGPTRATEQEGKETTKDQVD
jgi:hypothetical protein